MIIPNNYQNLTDINMAMVRVYFHTFMAVLTSMFISYFVGTNADLVEFFFTGATKWVVMFAPLVTALCITPVLSNYPSKPVALGLLHIFAAIMGLSLAAIFIHFKLGSIVNAFMGAAILFGIMSVYGYFTKTDLNSLGKYCIIALIAIIITSIINVFIGSSMLVMIISAIAIVIFLGLTAYDTQQIREMISIDHHESVEILGALNLYLDFINIFVNFLQLTGEKE